MRNEQTEKITEELKSEVLTYWRDTAKDKDAIARTADLFGIKEEDVKRIIAVRWKEKFVWNKENIFRLKAYMAQGMGNTEIAKQLGCKTQAVADFKRRNKDILPAYGKELKEEIINSIDVGKKKEPPVAGTAESSEKNIDVEVNSSDNNSNINVSESQDEDVITKEMYFDLYNRFLSQSNKNENASGILYDALLVLKTAKYAGAEWYNRYDTYKNELADCCRMYDMMISGAVKYLKKAIEELEDEEYVEDSTKKKTETE